MFLTALPAQVNEQLTSISSQVGWIDFVAAAAFLIGVFIGLRKGLTCILPWLAGVAAASGLAMEYHKPLAEWAGVKFPLPLEALQIGTFALLAAGSAALVWMFFLVLSFFGTVQFKPYINTAAGALAGGLQFLLAIGLLVSFLMLFPVPLLRDSISVHSVTGPYLIRSSAQIHGVFKAFLPAVESKKP